MVLYNELWEGGNDWQEASNCDSRDRYPSAHPSSNPDIFYSQVVTWGQGAVNKNKAVKPT